MGRFFGPVGYTLTMERPSYDINIRHTGIFEEDRIIEREYYGDTSKYGSKWNRGSGVNDDMQITTQISVLADAFMYENYSHIKYVILEGVRWKVTDITIARPRIILTLGGEYNGPQIEASECPPECDGY